MHVSGVSYRQEETFRMRGYPQKMDTDKDDTIENQTYSLNQIYFYMTEGCNLRCRHCWISPEYQTQDGSSNSLDFTLFQSIIEQAKPLGLSEVKLTGGEPLLHPQIKEILQWIHAQGWGWDGCGGCENGSLEGHA